MTKLKDLIKNNSAAGVVGEVIEKASNIADKFIQTKDEKAAFIRTISIQIPDLQT